MTLLEVLGLALAISFAVNIGLATGILAKAGGKSIFVAIGIGAGAAATVITLFLGAVAAYR